MSHSNGRKALVVGLGISGMATAIRLHQAGWSPTIVERARSRRTGGQFIGLFGPGQAAARRLGFLDAMPDRSVPGGVTYTVNRAGRRRAGLGVPDLPGENRFMMRSDVERAAFEALPADVEIRYGTSPTRIEQDASGVDVTLERAGAQQAERFDLVVGADGLRSTVRRLAFGPHQRYLRRLGVMVATFTLPAPIGGYERDSAGLFEPGRAMWTFPFVDHPPTALFLYRTTDVDAEFTGRPADRVRAAFGPQAPGPLLGEALAALDTADEIVFDSLEQVDLETWSCGRVVLVGDSAWCLTLFAGLGVSAGLAGADLLGTMLQRHPEDVGTALRAWENHLRPHIAGYQRSGREPLVFMPGDEREMALRQLMAHALKLPVLADVVRHFALGRSEREDRLDIARVH
ncbi:FAD-dependent oxidoreductase [Virgisporangium aliadipatigenens]|uniref:FAD-dependent oxidoreductase n=1 Tax=Virgisporangium aliadipatigenens TaxID=741659 RepID=A0A8J4DN95_9ACTN|nr:FAD-dependent monooxygenase [Virgisporangium aliadipatigenens]GIJ43317.1 FAD-dependent oxidoreductase [Virgisporangium aliadipatigenens]